VIKTALVFGGSYALGSLAGDKVAELAGFKTDAARTGAKIALGVVTFYVLSSVIR
jgi:hypothetical protein